VSGLRVSARRDEHVDELPELVDRTVHIAPSAGDLHIGLVHLPAISHAMPARPGGLGQQRHEPQHPPVDGDVVDLDAALGEEFFDVAVGQAEAQVPADREDDDIWWETKAYEGRLSGSRTRAVSSHAGSLAARRAHGERNSARTGA
jgi:hypothetical protein